MQYFEQILIYKINLLYDLDLETVKNCTFKIFTYHHAQSSGENACVLDDTIARLQHAFDLSTVTTNWKTLQSLAEVAKRPAFLLPVKK